MTVDGLTGREVTDFLLNCDDETYHTWWPGTHLELHVIKPGPAEDHVGDVVLMDEYIGSRRVRLVGEVIEAVPGEKVVWHFRLGGLRIPVLLTLALRARENGVRLRHTITAGWPGRARVLDPLWRLYFSKSFAGAMDRHVHTEFPLMRDLLHRAAGGGTTAPASTETSTITPLS
ncbi:hypothetical protein ACGFK1_08490 [Mycobacterium sp. NPDC048908]|uniref:hypothetical protein n=1 Tax=Mycobacterium sp. NPDC048908 TaxID=3364292 RepID=UPI00371B2EC2